MAISLLLKSSRLFLIEEIKTLRIMKIDVAANSSYVMRFI